MNQHAQGLFELADMWLKTNDIFYRDRLRSDLVPFPEYPTPFEYVAHMHLNIRPEDVFYKNKFEDAVHAYRGSKSTFIDLGEC